MPGSGEDQILERVQADARTAMKAGERERASALRVIADAVNQDARFGKDDPVATLRREHKKRVEAAEAYESGGRTESAAAERREADLIEDYLPEELGDDELAAIVDQAVGEVGAADPSQMGQVMSQVMPRVAGRADGKRVNQAVRERLGA